MVVLLFVSLLAIEPAKTFEVASVKPAAPSAVGPSFHVKTGARFGPGTTDATRWACDNCSLAVLLTEAYNLKRFQIAGPKWLDSERFDIVAQVAEGATKEDLHLMEQNLLAERFGLKVHFEQKEMQVYDLVVGKGSPKLKETAGTKPGAGALRRTKPATEDPRRREAGAEIMAVPADRRLRSRCTATPGIRLWPRICGSCPIFWRRSWTGR